MSETSKTIDEKIRLGQINYEVKPPKQHNQLQMKGEMSVFVSWVISIVCFLLVWGFYEIYQNYHIDFSRVFTVDFYVGAFYRILPETSGLPPLVFLAILAAFYCFMVVTAYNIFDVLFSPYWLITKKKKQRKTTRKWAVIILILLPIIIIALVIVLALWFGSSMFFGMFGLPNPFTKEGQKEYSKMPMPTESESVSINSNTSCSEQFNASIAMDQFQHEYTNAAAYAYNNGGPIIINDTHGLSADQIQIAISNSEAYLDSMGYKR